MTDLARWLSVPILAPKDPELRCTCLIGSATYGMTTELCPACQADMAATLKKVPDA